MEMKEVEKWLAPILSYDREWVEIEIS
jgi:hypothetical protein